MTPKLRSPRDAKGLRVEARPVLENVVLRTTAAPLFSEHLLSLSEARRLKKQLDTAIEKATKYKEHPHVK